jgi:hypothetical protein
MISQNYIDGLMNREEDSDLTIEWKDIIMMKATGITSKDIGMPKEKGWVRKRLLNGLSVFLGITLLFLHEG